MFRTVNEVLALCPQLALLMSPLLKEQDPFQNKVCSLVRGGPATPGNVGPWEAFQTGTSARGWAHPQAPGGQPGLFVLSPEAIAGLLFEEIAGRPVCADEQGGMGPHGANTVTCPVMGGQRGREAARSRWQLRSWDSPGAQASARGRGAARAPWERAVGEGAAGAGLVPQCPDMVPVTASPRPPATHSAAAP